MKYFIILSIILSGCSHFPSKHIIKKQQTVKPLKCELINKAVSDKAAVILSKNCLIKDKLTLSILLFSKDIKEAAYEASLMVTAMFGYKPKVSSLFSTVISNKNRNKIPLFVFLVIK